MSGINEQRVFLNEIPVHCCIWLRDYRAFPPKNVVRHDGRGWNISADLDKGAARRTVVNECVVDDVQLSPGIPCVAPFHSVGKNPRVFGLWALLNNVSNNIGSTTVGYIEFEAGSPIKFVTEPVILNVILCRTRFYQMADICVVGVGELERKFRDMIDVKVMC